MTITAGPVPAQYSSRSRPSCVNVVAVKPGTASVIACSSYQPRGARSMLAQSDLARHAPSSLIAADWSIWRRRSGAVHEVTTESVVHRLEVTESGAASEVPTGRIAAGRRHSPLGWPRKGRARQPVPSGHFPAAARSPHPALPGAFTSPCPAKTRYWRPEPERGPRRPRGALVLWCEHPVLAPTLRRPVLRTCGAGTCAEVTPLTQGARS